MDIRPDWIINAAAFTAVEEAETQASLAKLISSDAPKEISALKKQVENSTYIQIMYLMENGIFLGSLSEN